MIFPQTTEYALRAMAYVATLPADEAVRARDLSEKTGIPAHYVSKILRRLVVAGLLESQKGHGGGFVLGRPPREILISDILTATEQMPAPNQCAFGWGTCDPGNPCPLHPVWSTLSSSFSKWAGTTTLADVGPMPVKLPLRARKRS